ncbi:2,5-dioxovalerate dehydrogenase [Amylibacter kogurei]|uniref:2,5-dioxovalerate dehydrogenase n=1 Tax=Paramylibacter kogurei TaxID=1889778 RepID=A0A2G5KA24_9RHOB|nr:2,5-dioxovalerate dehydrogenase [Amylibacter kogurei]
MTYHPHGKILIDGNWLEAESTFKNAPISGTVFEFFNATTQQVDLACKSAERAFSNYSNTTRKERAAFLNTIADEIESRAEFITQIGTSETGLPAARLQGERGRTTGQLRLFAQHILQGDYLDIRHDPALPDREPAPRPELLMMQHPIGPVAVFGASNFPLAFSVAGGDTAAAFAAGCPVIVKGHPAHPGTSEIIAEAISAAITKTGMDSGIFSFLQTNQNETAAALVKHPLITAVGFTGSLRAGRILFDMCAARPTPIPFFGELGSVNPMFILANALENRTEEIANGWAASLSMGAGQFCTNPGVAVLIKGADADAFAQFTVSALRSIEPQFMLTDGIANAYRGGTQNLTQSNGVQELYKTTDKDRSARPNLFITTGNEWLANANLGEEVFGPVGIIVQTNDTAQMLEVVESLQGQLTCTLHMDEADTDTAHILLPILTRKAGRVLANGFPTGVEVSDTMVHGGPYPASTNFGATSVGTMAIRRFLRPVCFQNIPAELLPSDLTK